MSDESGSHSAVLVAIQSLGAAMLARIDAMDAKIQAISPLVAEHGIHREAQAEAVRDHENRLRMIESTRMAAADVAKLEDRVRELEKWRWLVLGAAVAGGGGAAALARAVLGH